MRRFEGGEVRRQKDWEAKEAAEKKCRRMGRKREREWGGKEAGV